jgi:hypothetical protein
MQFPMASQHGWKRLRKLMKHYRRHQPTEENGRHYDAANS